MTTYLPLIVFIGMVAIGGLLVIRFFSASLKEISNAAKDHAKVYAVAYIKGGALILIAVGASFDETFKSLTKAQALEQPWWLWATLFWKPIGAGLAVLVAFLDRSAQRAKEQPQEPKVT